MDQFVASWRRRLALHGAFIFLLAMLVGFPFMLAQNANFPDDLIKRWRIAHNEALAHTCRAVGGRWHKLGGCRFRPTCTAQMPDTVPCGLALGWWPRRAVEPRKR